MVRHNNYSIGSWRLGFIVAAFTWNRPITAGYLSSTIAVNDYGECWNVKGGVPKPVALCGDPPPADAGTEAAVLCAQSPKGIR